VLLTYYKINNKITIKERIGGEDYVLNCGLENTIVTAPFI
jgi:hypothetical protein